MKSSPEDSRVRLTEMAFSWFIRGVAWGLGLATVAIFFWIALSGG